MEESKTNRAEYFRELMKNEYRRERRRVLQRKRYSKLKGSANTQARYIRIWNLARYVGEHPGLNQATLYKRYSRLEVLNAVRRGKIVKTVRTLPFGNITIEYFLPEAVPAGAEVAVVQPATKKTPGPKVKLKKPARVTYDHRTVGDIYGDAFAEEMQQ